MVTLNFTIVPSFSFSCWSSSHDLSVFVMSLNKTRSNSRPIFALRFWFHCCRTDVVDGVKESLRKNKIREKSSCCFCMHNTRYIILSSLVFLNTLSSQLHAGTLILSLSLHKSFISLLDLQFRFSNYDPPWRSDDGSVETYGSRWDKKQMKSFLVRLLF